MKIKSLILALSLFQVSAWADSYSPVFKVNQLQKTTKTDLEQNIKRDISQLMSVFKVKKADFAGLDKKVIEKQEVKSHKIKKSVAQLKLKNNQ